MGPPRLQPGYLSQGQFCTVQGGAEATCCGKWRQSLVICHLFKPSCFGAIQGAEGSGGVWPRETQPYPHTGKRHHLELGSSEVLWKYGRAHSSTGAKDANWMRIGTLETEAPGCHGARKQAVAPSPCPFCARRPYMDEHQGRPEVYSLSMSCGMLFRVGVPHLGRDQTESENILAAVS